MDGVEGGKQLERKLLTRKLGSLMNIRFSGRLVQMHKKTLWNTVEEIFKIFTYQPFSKRLNRFCKCEGNILISEISVNFTTHHHFFHAFPRFDIALHCTIASDIKSQTPSKANFPPLSLERTYAWTWLIPIGGSNTKKFSRNEKNTLPTATTLGRWLNHESL